MSVSVNTTNNDGWDNSVTHVSAISWHRAVTWNNNFWQFFSHNIFDNAYALSNLVGSGQLALYESSNSDGSSPHVILSGSDTGWICIARVVTAGSGVTYYWRREGDTAWQTITMAKGSGSFVNPISGTQLIGASGAQPPYNQRVSSYKGWNAVLTSAQLLTESTQSLAVIRTNLVVETSMAVGSTMGADTSGSGNNWTITQTAGDYTFNADEPNMAISGGGGGAVEVLARRKQAVVVPDSFTQTERRRVPLLGQPAAPSSGFIGLYQSNEIAAVESFTATRRKPFLFQQAANNIGSAALSSFAASGSGALNFAGAAAAALSSLAAAGVGAITFQGVGSASTSSFAASGSAVELFISSGAAACSNFGATGAGAEAFSGSGNALCSSFANSGSGAEAFIASGSASLSSFASAGTSGSGVTGSGSAALSSFVASAVGVENFAGAGSAACSRFAASGAGAEAFIGSGGAACSAFAVSGLGTVGNALIGTGSAALSQLSAAGSGAEVFVGVGASACSSFAGSGSGTEAFSASGTAACASFAAAANGAQGTVFVGSGGAAISSFAVTGSTQETFVGVVGASISPLGAGGSGAATLAISGSCAAMLSSFGASGSGLSLQAIIGSGAAECSPFTAISNPRFTPAARSNTAPGYDLTDSVRRVRGPSLS